MWIKALSIVFAIFVGVSAQASCKLDRYPDLGEIRKLKPEIAKSVEEFELQRQGIERKRRNERIDRNTPPIDLGITGSVDQLAGQEYQSAEARLSYDLNVPLQILNRKRSFLLDKNYAARLANIGLEEDIFYLQKALTWVFSREQKKLYRERLRILEEQKVFYEEKKRQGASVISEISKINLEIVSLKNKILAVSSREEMLAFEFSDGNWNILSKTRLDWSPQLQSLNCELNSYEKMLAQDNIEYYRNQKKIDWLGNTTSISAYASQDLIDRQQRPSFGINLEIKLLSTKQRGRAVRAAEADVDQAMRDLTVAEIRLRKLYKEQENVEALIFENIAAIRLEIWERRRLLEELSVRAALGQTVFEEKSATQLEMSSLEEVRLQRVYDLYTGWLQFMQVRGLE